MDGIKYIKKTKTKEDELTKIRQKVREQAKLIHFLEDRFFDIYRIFGNDLFEEGSKENSFFSSKNKALPDIIENILSIREKRLKEERNRRERRKKNSQSVS